MENWPVFTPVGDSALLIEFGRTLDEVINDRVLALDAALAANPPVGMCEAVPAYASLLVNYDPLVTDAAALAGAVRGVTVADAARAAAEHVVPVCYDDATGPDLAAAAAALVMPVEDLIARHLAGEYRVYMYGFAPGYAYLGGVPAELRLPRKTEPVRSRPVGSVMITGGQCLVTTLPMPTGWWVIGRSPLRILQPDAARPFRFDPGDRVRFTRISRGELEAG